ncbi:hypothetical protein V8D89_009114 [Ganoderma adspersum]
MLSTSSRALVLLFSGAALLGATDARRILPKPDFDLEPVATTATAPIFAHTQPPEQRVGHTIVHRQETTVTKPLNDPSSVSSLLSQLSTATAASSGTGSANATAAATATSTSSSIPFLSIGSEPTDFGSSSAATATAKAGGGGNGAAAVLSVGSVKAGIVLAGALAAYMALA